MRDSYRFQEILNILDEKQTISIKCLSNIMHTSLSTLYRDLNQMEKAKLIIRMSGQIKKSEQKYTPSSFDFRANMQAAEKHVLAKCAADIVVPHSTIFMDASTTVAQIVDYLNPKDDITAITNSLYTADKLRQKRIRTFFLGGNLVKHSCAVGGVLSKNELNRYQIDAFFFSAYGVNSLGNVSTSFEDESILLRWLFKKQIFSVFLCDSSKFGRSSHFKVANYNDIDIAILTQSPPGDLLPPHCTIINSVQDLLDDTKYLSGNRVGGE